MITFSDLLAIAAAVAIALVWLVVLPYWWRLRTRRLEELDTNLWQEEARRFYVALFTGHDVTPKQPRTEQAWKEILRGAFYNVHGWFQYLWRLILLTAAVSAAVWTLRLWAMAQLGAGPTDAGKLDLPIVLALAGAYVWTVYELIERTVMCELVPGHLMEMTLRLVAAIPIGYAFSLLAVGHAEALFAFAAAAFPLRDVRRLIRRYALKKIEAQAAPGGRQAIGGHLRTILDGVGDKKILHLEEIGIETYNDLAYADPLWVMARSGYSLRLVIAWTDQALLAVYAPAHKVLFAQFGIPCALDAVEFYERHCFDVATKQVRAWDQDSAVKALAAGVKLPPALLVDMLWAVHRDPHVQFINKIWYSGVEETGLVE
jgi:hypothetical protein